MSKIARYARAQVRFCDRMIPSRFRPDASMPHPDAAATNKIPNSLADVKQQIAHLQQQNERQRDDAIERKLIDLRISAAPLALSEAKASEWQRNSTLELTEGPHTIPEIHASELSASHVASGILNHGALIVRNLLDERTCDQLRGDIDRTFESRSAQAEGKHTGDAWYSMPSTVPRPALPGGAIWAACAPRPMHTLLEIYESLGLRPILNEYLGQETMLSVKKWVLRKAEALDPSGWHQDGAFMGSNIRSANLWISLSKCGAGTDAPGIDIVPTRLNKIVDTGTEGAPFDWSVSNLLVDTDFADTPPVTPVFNEGDAIFFDHFNLHRTSPGMHYTATRYAIECWFLGAENYPPRQIPMFW